MKKRNLFINFLLIFLSSMLFLFITYFFNNTENSKYTGACKDCNVILFTYDAFRGDHFGLINSDAPANITPNLDSFASDALIFPKAYAHIGLTGPSLTSLFTSKYPFVSFDFNENISQTDYFLTDTLQKNGYHNIYYATNPWMHNNYIKGFDESYDRYAPFVNNTDEILKILSMVDSSKPFFYGFILLNLIIHIYHLRIFLIRLIQIMRR